MSGDHVLAVSCLLCSVVCYDRFGMCYVCMFCSVFVDVC